MRNLQDCSFTSRLQSFLSVSDTHTLHLHVVGTCMNPNHQMRRSDPLPACVAAGVVQCISRYGKPVRRYLTATWSRWPKNRISSGPETIASWSFSLWASCSSLSFFFPFYIFRG